MEAQTIAQMFVAACEKYNKPNAVIVKRDGEWKSISHQQWRDHVTDCACALIGLGVQNREHVAIIGETRYEWAVSDLAVVSSGAVSVPIYATLSADHIAWILNNADAVGAIVSSKEQAEKLESVRHQCPMLRFIVMMDEKGAPEGVITLEDLASRGRAANNRSELESRIKAGKADDLLTIIYTSGTTGNPKGVMLSNHNLIANIESCMQIAPFTPEDTCLSHLPLSHVLERMGGFFLMTHCGVSIAYAEDISTVADNLQEIKPTVLFSVPRLFEKIYGRIIANAMTSGLIKRAVFTWAMSVGKKALPFLTHDKPIEGFLGKQWAMADKMVYSKVKEKTGGNLKFMISGGAALSREISEMFLGLGITISEGYGLTETSPVLAINPVNAVKPGTVGPAVPGVTVHIAQDGEILATGPNIMQGYYKNPEATESTIVNGWIHTGDIGVKDEDGYITITDRKKDLIITSGGKNVAPQPMENVLKLSPFIEQIVVIGNDRKFISALIVPPWETIEDWAPGMGWPTDPKALVGNEEFNDMLMREVNIKMKDFAAYERVKKFEILPQPFSIETGELTPSLKVKRKVVNEKYAGLINKMYQ